MPDQEPNDYVIPVVQEEVHADAVPVETGGVRVFKRTESHDEVIEQAVRQGRVDVKRVPVNRPVAGPMEPRNEGQTLIVPVVSEVLRIEKQWVLIEEIHLTNVEETRTVSEQVTLNKEVAQVQRLDEEGRVISEIASSEPRNRVRTRGPEPPESPRRVLASNSSSMVKKS